MRKNPYWRFVLIAVEGIDGAGKTSMVERLWLYLESLGHRVDRTKEPWFGGVTMTNNDELLKAAIYGPTPEAMPSREEIQALMVDNRGRHYLYRVGGLATGMGCDVLLSERCFLSTFAYAEATTTLTREKVIEMHEALPEFFLPDLTLVLDVPAEEAMERITTSRAKRDLFEKRGVLGSVREAYLGLADIFADDGVVAIDAVGSQTEVFDRAKVHVDRIFKEKFGLASE